jgi:hypothetical protein
VTVTVTVSDSGTHHVLLRSLKRNDNDKRKLEKRFRRQQRAVST